MCGLVGFIGGTLHREDRLKVVSAMAKRIAHRGPDDSGEWVDERSGTAFGFRRLAIIDLSPAGHQPMASASQRYVIAFNGEVYNYEAIRAELVQSGLAPSFRGHSDTEVMLAAFEAWGIAAAVKRFIGMFAIAVWDRELQQLTLIRDRMGVKPLYLGRAGGTFLFASELKALHAHPEFRGAIDRHSLALYFRYMYVPAPYTIFENVEKVMPGTMVTITAAGEISRAVYWSAALAAERGLANRFQGGEDDAVTAVDALLQDAVGIRMVADVPVGVFLSGGVDSSLVAAYMQAQSRTPVKTFSIGFSEAEFNEAEHAAAVARHLGTDHTELYVTPEESLAVIPKLPSMFDEPFADSSQIPTHLVSAMARSQVTVSLSGDGGDELFGGYYRYFMGQRAWKAISPFPRPLRLVASRAIMTVPKPAWDAIFSSRWSLAPRSLRQRSAGERLHKFARILTAADDDAMYFELVSHWRDLVIDGVEPPLHLHDRTAWPPLTDPIDRMMYFDQISYLPDDILVKVDRASMSVSLEAREPLLDHRLVELAWSLPLSMKVRAGKGKWVLRKLLDRLVPRELIERPKMGFGIPLDAWLRGPLRPWAEALLDEQRLRAEGFLDVLRVRAIWKEHLSGKGNWQHYIWAILMFQAWYEQTGNVQLPQEIEPQMVSA
jgi:asparagine synthase (glutamine-hydrolysing)